MKKQFILITILTLFISSFSQAQDYLGDITLNYKNELFKILNVKKVIKKHKIIRTSDSVVVSKKFTIQYYDTSGFVTKKEEFDSLFNSPKSTFEYKRNENGLYTELYLNGKLREKKEYNDLNDLEYFYYFDEGKLSSTSRTVFDSLGNDIAHITTYSSGKIDTTSVSLYEYDYSFSPPKIKSENSIYIENNYIRKYISKYDSSGRCTKLITEYPYKSKRDSTFYYHDDKNHIDSTISFSNNKTKRFVTNYDTNWRELRSLQYNEADSITYMSVFTYNDSVTKIRDMLVPFTGKIVPMTSFDLLNGIQKLQHYDRNQKLTFLKEITYYANSLPKQEITLSYNFNRIEETNYEYEFFEK